jgi:hypothetical protein
MQSRESVIQSIKAAFEDVGVPRSEEVLADSMRGSDDAVEMLNALSGKHWSELSIQTLFYHREMIQALSAIGYRAYLPAFLVKSLDDDARHAADLYDAALYSIMPVSEDRRHIELAENRTSLLDAKQRMAISDYLRYVGGLYDDKEARSALREWESLEATKGRAG